MSPPPPSGHAMRTSISKRPSTPPLSSPGSPDDSRSGILHTPLALSHPPVLATPQSLRMPRSFLVQDNIKLSSSTSTYKTSSSAATNRRVHEDSPSDGSNLQDHKSTEGRSIAEPATPVKRPGPFTPQVAKQPRDPLRSDISNYLVSDDHQVRGSLTDPPPRRRGEIVLQPSAIRPLDIDLPPQADEPNSMPSHPTSQPVFSQPTCASCGGAGRLSLLQPCQHAICASCVTGSLNVVGEKNMICMYCLSPIDSFKICHSSKRIHPDNIHQPAGGFQSRPVQKNSFRPRGIQPNQAPRSYPSPEFSLPEKLAPPSASDISVLRIDNVPWDVTPFMVEQWLGSPTIHCHVLLDREDGRTLNHAYVEVVTNHARAALRSHQNKIIGYGRRARPVTLTMCGQEELMHDLFPSWTGRFRGPTPIYEALPTELPPADFLTGSELLTMLRLIQDPKSHFLKVPSLAYWSLLSALIKYPAKDVFAPGSAPDILFDISVYALEKYETFMGTPEYDCVLHTRLVAGAIHCQAFTDRQLQFLLRFANQLHPATFQRLAPNPSSSATTRAPHYRPQLPFSPDLIQHAPREGIVSAPMGPEPYAAVDPRDRVAHEFGIDPSLVHALAERLTLHSTVIGSLRRH